MSLSKATKSVVLIALVLSVIVPAQEPACTSELDWSSYRPAALRSNSWFLDQLASEPASGGGGCLGRGTESRP